MGLQCEEKPHLTTMRFMIDWLEDILGNTPMQAQAEGG